MRWCLLVLALLLLLAPYPAEAAFHRACDGFVFLADESESMFNEDVLAKEPKIEIEKKVLALVNQDVPAAEYQAALRAFGHDYSFSNPYQSVLYYAPAPYRKDKMARAIEKIRASRAPTPLGYGLEMAGKDVSMMSGRVHIVLFSDGNENAYRPSVDVARELGAEFPGRICLYAVQVGHSPEGRKRLEEIVSALGCGKVYRALDLTEEPLRAAFVREVFGYEEPEPRPAPRPALKDSDGDGVYDHLDRCPGTPRGARVDAHGCWKPGLVFFDFDRTEIKPEYRATLEEIARVLRLNPDLRVRIVGATDSRGSRDYNYRLGLRRAEAVKDFLVKRGVCPSQLEVKSVGEGSPMESNETETGRARNRYVRFEIIR